MACGHFEVSLYRSIGQVPWLQQHWWNDCKATLPKKHLRRSKDACIHGSTVAWRWQPHRAGMVVIPSKFWEGLVDWNWMKRICQMSNIFASEIAVLYADLGLFFPASAGSATAVQTRVDPRETLAHLHTVYEDHCSIRTYSNKTDCNQNYFRQIGLFPPSSWGYNYSTKLLLADFCISSSRRAQSWRFGLLPGPRALEIRCRKTPRRWLFWSASE